MKGDGLLVIGISFPEDKIESKPDYHIHLNISKQACVERRKMFLEKHKDEENYGEDYKLIGSVTEKLKMNQLIFPYYLESIKKAKINKFININEMNNDVVYDTAFDALIDMIKKYLKQDNGQSNKSESEEESDSDIRSSDSSINSDSENQTSTDTSEKNDTVNEVTTDTIPDVSESSLSKTPKVSHVSKMSKFSKKKDFQKKDNKKNNNEDTTIRIHAQMLGRPKYRYELENKKERDRGNMNMMNQFLNPEDFSSDEGPIEFVKI